MIINTNQTITSLTVRTIPQLLEIVKKYRKINPKIGTHFSMVTEREWMHPSVFGRKFWEDDVKNILNVMPIDSERDIVACKYMEGTFAQIPVESDQKQIKNLKNFLDQIDKRRNTNWREVYPYLDI